MAPSELRSRKYPKLFLVYYVLNARQLLDKALKEVSSFDNELHIFVPYSFLWRQSWDIDAWPSLADTCSDEVELIVPPSALERA